MRERWNDFKAMLRGLFNPRWVDDEPDTTTPEVIARWVDGPPESTGGEAMTPAERLLAAADLLDKRAGEATEGPWVFDRHTYELDMDSSGYDVDGPTGGYTSRLSSIGDARYIATMHPGVGKALALVLRDAVDRITNNIGWRIPNGLPPHPVDGSLLDLADLLLAGES